MNFYQEEGVTANNVSSSRNVVIINIIMFVFFEKNRRKLWLRARADVHLNLNKAAMLAIITSGRHFFGPATPLLYVTCSFNKEREGKMTHCLIAINYIHTYYELH